MTTETNVERLESITRYVGGLLTVHVEEGKYEPELFNAFTWLIEQAEQGQKSEALIRRLYNLLGSSAELDFKLWKETESYVKALAGETNG